LGSQQADLVVGIGNGLVVHTIRVPRFLPPGGKGEVRSIGTCAGGVTANALVQLASLGIRTEWLGIVGRDSNANLLIDALGQAGVGVGVVHRIEGETGFGFVITDDKGERIGYCNQGVNAQLTAEQVWKRFGSVIRSARILLAEVCQFPISSTIAAVELAHEAGVEVVLDFDSSPHEAGLAAEKVAGIEQLLGRCTVVSGSCSALRDYTGLTSAEEVCRFLLDYGVKLAVVTLGQEGCYLRTHMKGCHVPGFPVEVVDTTGAGDAFRGGLVHAYMHDVGLEEAGMFANACGALCCTSPMNQSCVSEVSVRELMSMRRTSGIGGA